MSKQNLSESLNYQKLALQNRCLGGEFEQKELPDLQGSVSELVGKVSYHLQFTEKFHLCFVEGKVSTVLHLRCLQCLSPITFPVEAKVSLVVAEAEVDDKLLPEGCDVWFINEKPFSLGAMLLDELLLAMPIDIRHENNACMSALEPKAKETRVNPFRKLEYKLESKNGCTKK